MDTHQKGIAKVLLVSSSIGTAIRPHMYEQNWNHLLLGTDVRKYFCSPIKIEYSGDPKSFVTG